MENKSGGPRSRLEIAASDKPQAATLWPMFFMFGCGSLFLLLLIGNRRRVRLNACSSNNGLVNVTVS